MADSVIVNKTMSIERCLKRIEEDYIGHEADFEDNFMRQDAILLNIQRACEQSIDLANHLVKTKKLGVPQNTKHVFELLRDGGIIQDGLTQKLSKMVGFRNVAVHDYTKLDLAIVKSIIEKHLTDFREYIKIALQYV